MTVETRMTAEELIEKLQRIPGTAGITIVSWEDDYSFNDEIWLSSVTYDAKENEVYFEEQQGYEKGMKL